MRTEFNTPDVSLILAQGAAIFYPDAKFGLPAQVIGEADVSANDTSTFTDVKSRMHRDRRVIKRKLTERTSTYTITAYQETEIVSAWRNLGRPRTAPAQAAGVGVPPAASFLAITSAKKNQVDNLGFLGTYDVMLDNAGEELVEDEDYSSINTSGDIQWLKDFPVLDLSDSVHSHIPFADGEETVIGEETEITGYLKVVQTAEDDQRPREFRVYVAVNPNGDLAVINGDDGETGWAFEARKLSDPAGGAFASGRARTLPSVAEIEAVANA